MVPGRTGFLRVRMAGRMAAGASIRNIPSEG